ncbi:MAG: L-lactate dehydrogenase [Telmatospirillum sp.]|nr:L-lactate dehydrogenase [Telmatospirillum sp.]
MKVSVIGMGAVGTELVGYLVNLSEVSEIVAVDKAAEKAEAEIWDFGHTTSFIYAKNPRLVAGDYPDTAGSDVVVITAGAQLQRGQTRDSLVQINAQVIKDIIGQVERHSPEAIVLIVTNPVDVITQVALRHSSYPRTRLISAGTIVDTARLMRILSDHLDVDPKNIFGYVLGDHSSTGFIPWSVCNVCGLDIDTYCRLNGIAEVDKAEVRRRVLDVGIEIFNRKGNTNHAIAASVFRVIRAIAANEHSVLPVGVLLDGEYGIEDVVMSVPCVIAAEGVRKILNYQFTRQEQNEFLASETHLRSLLSLAGL